MSQTLRIGFVGAGGNTRRKHIPGFRAITNVELLGVVNRSEASSKAVAKEFDIPRTYATWQHLVDDPEVDAVCIGTWPYMHAPVTIASLEAGKHVLCEARMAASLPEARAMLEVSRANPELVAQVVPSPFTLTVDETVKEMIAEGFLGEVLAVELRAGGGFIDPEAPMSWRHDIDYSGINTMSLGIWYEALMRWIGPARQVAAMAKTCVPMRADETGTRRAMLIPDHLNIVAEMACGAQACMTVSSACGFSGGPEAYLYGSKGTLRITGEQVFGGTCEDDQLEEIPIEPELKGRWRVEEEFVEAIRGQGEVTLTTFEDGLRYMAFTDAVLQAARTGQTIPVENT